MTSLWANPRKLRKKPVLQLLLASGNTVFQLPKRNVNYWLILTCGLYNVQDCIKIKSKNLVHPSVGPSLCLSAPFRWTINESVVKRFANDDVLTIFFAIFKAKKNPWQQGVCSLPPSVSLQIDDFKRPFMFSIRSIIMINWCAKSYDEPQNICQIFEFRVQSRCTLDVRVGIDFFLTYLHQILKNENKSSVISIYQDQWFVFIKTLEWSITCCWW